MWWGGGERLGGAGGGTAHISYMSCKTCSFVVSLSRAHSSAVSKRRGRVGREGELWGRGRGSAHGAHAPVSALPLSLSRSFYLPPHTHIHTHRHTKTQSISRERARAHELCASPLMLFTLYSFFRGETAAAAAIRSSARHSVVVKARRGAQWSS